MWDSSAPPPAATTMELSISAIHQLGLVEPMIKIAEEGEIRSLKGWRRKHYIPIGNHSQEEWRGFRHALLDKRSSGTE